MKNTTQCHFYIYIGVPVATAIFSAVYCHIYNNLVHVLLWALWFSWHTALFKKMAQKNNMSYNHIILYLVVPGVSLFITLILAPAIIALSQEAFKLGIVEFLGIGLLIVSVKLFSTSIGTIGFDNAAFKNEFEEEKEQLVCKSIYSSIRHPLYLSGILFSLGLYCTFGATCAGVIVLLNIFSTIPYKYFEERRLIEVYGEEYRQYIRSTKAFCPLIF